MLILITYDINTLNGAGVGRLSRIAKLCLNYGQRVQNSVYECNVDAAQYRKLKAEILSLINDNEDSIRIYNLGDNYHSKVEHFGIRPGYDAEDFLMI